MQLSPDLLTVSSPMGAKLQVTKNSITYGQVFLKVHCGGFQARPHCQENFFAFAILNRLQSTLCPPTNCHFGLHMNVSLSSNSCDLCVSRTSQQTYLAGEHSLWPDLSFGTSCHVTMPATSVNILDCFKWALKTLLFQWVGVFLQMTEKKSITV